MKKFILSTIFLGNSALLMSQNTIQTNILVQNQSTRNVAVGGWLINVSGSNTNKPATNRSRQTNIAVQSNRSQNDQTSNRNTTAIQQRNIPVNNRNTVINRNLSQVQAPTNTNSAPIQQRSRAINPADNVNQNISENNQSNRSFTMNEDKQAVISNGMMEIQVDNVQAQQIQFLASTDNESNLQLQFPELNFAFNDNLNKEQKTEKVKEVKTSFTADIKTAKVKTEKNISFEVRPEKASISKNTVKRRTSSSYSQENKNYFGKKVKIWCKKNLKFVRKIRMSVSCPEF